VPRHIRAHSQQVPRVTASRHKQQHCSKLQCAVELEHPWHTWPCQRAQPADDQGLCREADEADIAADHGVRLNIRGPLNIRAHVGSSGPTASSCPGLLQGGRDNRSVTNYVVHLKIKRPLGTRRCPGSLQGGRRSRHCSRSQRTVIKPDKPWHLWALQGPQQVPRVTAGDKGSREATSC
jgi:hypothetical protein